MSVEVLLATMHLQNEEIEDFLRAANIDSDIVIGNQCDRTEDLTLRYGEHAVTVLSRTDRGVGKNRNETLAHSQADFLIFADNDVRYYDGYAEKIEKYYREHADADVVIFNFKKRRGDEPWEDLHSENKRATFRHMMRFGAIAVTARRESLFKARVTFSLLFGGGAKYGSGEDSLFLIDCYKRGLRVYLCSETLGEVDNAESTWFHGYDEKYFYDRGALFKAMCPRIYRFGIMWHVFKYRKRYIAFGPLKKVRAVMLKGAREYTAR